MARKVDPNLEAKTAVTTYLTAEELERLDGLAMMQGRISRAATLRWLLQKA